jgi:hypothetical protein
MQDRVLAAVQTVKAVFLAAAVAVAEMGISLAMEQMVESALFGPEPQEHSHQHA